MLKLPMPKGMDEVGEIIKKSTDLAKPVSIFDFFLNTVKNSTSVAGRLGGLCTPLCADTGVSMFHTSIVLSFGFSVFMISDFGGTVALGGLVSVTLVFATLANLLLLLSLLLSLERNVAYRKEFKEPSLKIIDTEDSMSSGQS